MNCFVSVFVLFVFVVNISYGQSFECDNNFGDCGTPERSGGGGGGGSVLISNTEWGDTHQNADDFDDDGVEDSSDNCIRISNPYQTEREGDGSGDSCDNCLNVWNQDQQDTDGNGYGDSCDNDDDGDGIEDYEDICPLNWGNDYCENTEYHYNIESSAYSSNYYYNKNNEDIDNKTYIRS